jgi:phytoene dehydrogenase-like protein
MRWDVPSDEISFKDWLLQYTDNVRVHQIFNMMCLGTSGSISSILSAGEFIRILKNYGKYGGEWVLPRGHLKPLVDGIVNAIKSKGGEIQTGTRVKEILVEEQLVKGVLAEEKGKELKFESQVVINDCSPYDMIRMAGEKNFDQGYLKQVQGMRTPEGFNILWNCDKPAFDWPGVINFPQYESPFYAVDFSLTWRDFAPEGKYTVWAGFGLPQGSYDIKKEIERGIMQCKENFPILEKQGQILVVQVFRKNWPLLWATCGHDLPQKTPVENLYIVGDAAKPTGCTMAEGVVEGARLVVEDIKRRINPL